MGVWNQLGKRVSGAVSRLEERNRHMAHINRIRGVLKREEKAAEREYLALGRYYYNSLRDADNPVTEPHCAELAKIEKRLGTAINELERLYAEAAERKAQRHVEVTLEDVSVSDVAPEIVETVKNAAENLRDTVAVKTQAAAETAVALKDDLKDAAGAVGQDLRSAAGEIGAEVKSAASAVKEDVTKAADKMKQEFSGAAKQDENSNLPFSGDN